MRFKVGPGIGAKRFNGYFFDPELQIHPDKFNAENDEQLNKLMEDVTEAP